MSVPLDAASLEKLKAFVSLCTARPEVLHAPQLEFFKKFIESWGGKIPEVEKPDGGGMKSSEESKPEEPQVEVESDPESDLELDMEGCIEPEPEDADQKMGDPVKEVSEEDSDKANEKRQEAMMAFSEGNFEKSIELYTEAIELNPQSALLFAKRGQVYLKLNKPKACIKDCTRALELNCDSAAAYKFRGRAFRLIGEWEKAARDLRQACNIDFDEQADEWLREVTPNAKKIENHKLKQERKKLEREEREKMERIRRAREAHAKAAQESTPEDAFGDGGSSGAAGMGDFYKLLQDPEVMSAFRDPEVAKAFEDISQNPSNLLKYQSNPKIMALLTKLSSKFAGSGMNFPGFPNFAGAAGGFPGAGFPGAGGGSAPPPPPPTAPEDDGLD